MKQFKPIGFLLFFVGVLIAFQRCAWNKNEPQMAFYYWKSDFVWTAADSLKADSLKLQKMYIKLFDVKYTPSNYDPAMPAATLQFSRKFPKNLTLVPVVYIENEVFKVAEPDVLSAKIYNRMEEMLNSFGATSVTEFQIDCDWTTKTKEAYFQFLKTLKSKLNPKTLLSATIRLHQIKYVDKTGAPPVDKGLLMYYNMTDIKNLNAKNSILDNQEAVKYLRNKNRYPLPLDFALPIFEWSVLFKEQQIAAIISDINRQNINQLSFLKQESEHQYRCIKDTLWQKQYLRVGDILRHEYVSSEELQIAAKICKEELNHTQPNIIFFHWDKNNLIYYDNNVFEKTISYFR